MCKIPGLGPVAPQGAREIAQDAFLNGVFFDGVDLRHVKRYSRDSSIDVRVALELGDAPDEVVCTDCGNRFRTEFDHVQPRVALGPTSNGNLKPRCWSCHKAKTERDRRAGKLKPPEPWLELTRPFPSPGSHGPHGPDGLRGLLHLSGPDYEGGSVIK